MVSSSTVAPPSRVPPNRDSGIRGTRWHDRSVPLTWLPDQSVDSLRSALIVVAPQLSKCEINLLAWIDQSKSLWHGSSVFLDVKLVALTPSLPRLTVR